MHSVITAFIYTSRTGPFLATYPKVEDLLPNRGVGQHALGGILGVEHWGLVVDVRHVQLQFQEARLTGVAAAWRLVGVAEAEVRTAVAQCSDVQVDFGLGFPVQSLNHVQLTRGCVELKVIQELST